MKRLKILNILCLAILFTACKEKKPIDNYVGDYVCYKKKTTSSMDTVYSSIESIELISVKKIEDSLFQILDATVKINTKTGYFGYPDDFNSESGYKIFQGHFVGDSIYIITYKGGLGAGTNCSYKGIKQ